MKTYNDFISAMSSEGFNERDGQRILSWNLLDLVKRGTGTQYALQAPTGTGKSVAALLAGVESAREKLGRVCIGTSTVILSEQYSEDIALVNRVFPDVKIFVLKGASHYICWNKVDQHMSKVKRWPETFEECKQQIIDFNMGRSEKIPSWAQASTEDCKQCRAKNNSEASSTRSAVELKRFENCTFSVARSAARAADVIVTSHAMISVDLSLKKMTEVAPGEDGGVLGPISTYIFDEAHKLNSLLYTQSVSPWDVRKLAKHGVISVMGGISSRHLVEHFEDILFQADPSKNKTGRTGKPVSADIGLVEAVNLLSFFPNDSEISRMRDFISASVLSPDSREASKLQRELIGIVDAFSSIRTVLEEMSADKFDGDLALWRSVSRFGGDESMGYNVRSMEASPWLLKALQDYRVAWMSATLGIDGQEDYVLDSFGIKGCEFYEIESPFDYSKQMEVVFVDEKSFNRYSDDSFINTVEWLNSVLPGGTLVLTDSHKTSEWITKDLDKRGVYAASQDRKSARANSALVDAQRSVAKSGGNPVLSGVDVFSTGLNLSGNACTAVFVHTIKAIRSPRAYISWRRRWMEARGQDSFRGYILPEQAIVLEQQMGRLIRSESDYGIVLVSCNLRSEEQVEIARSAVARFPGVTIVSDASVAGARFKETVGV